MKDEHTLTASEYIDRNRDALRANNPCYWAAYADDPLHVWRTIAHMIGDGLGEFPPADVKRELGRLYGIIPECCIRAAKPVPVGAKQFIVWIKERYEPGN